MPATLEEAVYEYNLQNRLAKGSITPFVENEPQTARVTEYRYNPDGIRVWSCSYDTPDGGASRSNETVTDYLIDADNFTGYAQVLEETISEDNGQGGWAPVSRMYYTIGDDVIAQTKSTYSGGVWTTEQSQYLLYDGYGVMLSNGSGADAASNAATNLLYAGEQYDKNADQYYLRARYYNPANGLFNRVDPYSGNLQEPQSLHKYLYCHNNPVNAIDPTGMFSIAEVNITIRTQATMFSRVAQTVGRVYSYVDKIQTGLDIFTGIHGLMVQDWKTIFASAYAQYKNNASFMTLFQSEFWVESSFSFMSNMGRIVSGLLADPEIVKNIVGVLNNTKREGYPKLVIQLPIPNEFPVPRMPLIPTGLSFKIGKKHIPIALEVGGNWQKWRGRVLGFAVASGPDPGHISQFLRQDYGHNHGGWNQFRWPDPIDQKYKLHYVIDDRS